MGTTYAYYPAAENNNRLKRIQVGNLLDLEYAKYDEMGNILTMIGRIEGGVTYTQTWNFDNKLDQIDMIAP